MSWYHWLIEATALVLAATGLARLFQSRKGSKSPHYWTSIPVVGVPGDTWLHWARAVFNSVARSSDMASSGYELHCKRDVPFIIPSSGSGSLVILPPSQLHVLNKPESQVEALHSQIESFQPRYTMGSTELLLNPIHFSIVRNEISKNLDLFADMFASELDRVFQECWGVSKEWTTVNAWNACMGILVRLSNRAYFGPTLCRDDHLIEQSRLYGMAVYGGASFITALPTFMKPALGHLIGLPARIFGRNCRKILGPSVEQRMRDMESDKALPDDILQWLIQRSTKAGPVEMDVAQITQRLISLNIFTIFTINYALTNCVLDLYGSDSKEYFLEGLQEECNRICSQHNRLSTKSAIDKLSRMDSTVRESMRVSSFGIISLPRIVAPGKGLDLGNGIQIPPGVRVAFPSRAIHHDDSRFYNPLVFDAFRFSKSCEGTQDAKQRLTTTFDESFLAYGYGKHACPGR